ncbi:MAG: ABC-F family ATP-binding cassette domain-containing protein, partial [Solobacterium sp.]|nr:ABC-F family ATP-binding cassette domain-containing protein [Solobacterium sp.]
SSYVTQKNNNQERQAIAYRHQQAEIKRLEELIERFRYKKNKAAFAQSKIKYLERMDRVEEVKPGDTKTFHAHFTPRLKGGQKVLETDELGIGYDHVLTTVTMLLERGQRIGILGPNGTGKSTFVKTLMGLIPPLSGSYLYGYQIEPGYFDQQLAQFTGGKTVLEELWDEYPDLDRTTVRSVLGQFLFSADDVFKMTDVLSGGEKVRLSLAKLLLRHSNLLILDEPTNHLDILSKEALEDSLSDYTGSVLFVSHDRYFIRRLANALIVFENGKAVFYPMTYDEYEEMKKGTAADLRPQENKKQKEEKPRELSPEARRREINKTEEEITLKEAELEEKRALRFEPEYYQDYQKMAVLDEEIDDLHNELAHLYEKWEKLSS